jgi:hypothetical protein
MTGAVPTTTLGQATALPIQEAAQRQRASQPPQGLVSPLFTGGSQSINVGPLQTTFQTLNQGAVAPDGRTDSNGYVEFWSIKGGTGLSGALVASPCKVDGAGQIQASGSIQYDLKSGSSSSNGDQQCSTTLSDYTVLGATYSWNSSASWSGGRLVLSGTATVVKTNSRLSANDAEHIQVEEQATLRISGGICTVESYRLVERKSRPNSAYFTHQTHVSTEQAQPGTSCGFN